MRKLSLKMKLTLLYTALMMAVICVSLGILFSLSSHQILASVQMRLRESVFEASEDVDYDDGRLEFDSDLNDLENGVYLSVYDSDGTFLYGRTPYNFSNTMAFEDGNLRSDTQNGQDYYVLDVYASVENYGNVYIRGVASATEAEASMLVIRNLALIFLPLIAVLTGVLGYFMTRRTLKPVSLMTETVQQIRREKDLSRRIDLGKGKDEIYRLAHTFDELLDQVETSLKREQQFTSDVSHELRTPVSSMMLQCEELLSRQDLDEETRQGLQFLEQKIRYLTQMISQLLLLSRADQGRQQLMLESLNFSELTEMAVLEARDMAEPKGIQIETDIQPQVTLCGDETLMIRMWMNLLENAVRYGKEQGHIFIWLHRQDNTISGGVKDDGIGISEEDLPHIWERFYQADTSRTVSSSSGLGLSMVAWIVRAHHGEIQVESRLGEGSTFSFQFPAAGKLEE